jgi:hypothetical protein
MSNIAEKIKQTFYNYNNFILKNCFVSLFRAALYNLIFVFHKRIPLQYQRKIQLLKLSLPWLLG